MNVIYKYFSFAIIILLLTTCKKYDDGGFVKQTCKHLFGGHKAGDNKTWKLKLYEVNGIDSTMLIQGANNIPDFYEKFVVFNLTDPKYYNYRAETYLYQFSGDVVKNEKQLGLNLFNKWTHADSIQCVTKNNIQYCCRNILLPEVNKSGIYWQIKKLTKNEFVITVELKNSYKIVLIN